MLGIDRTSVATISRSSFTVDTNRSSRSSRASRAMTAKLPVAGISESTIIEKSKTFHGSRKYRSTRGETANIFSSRLDDENAQRHPVPPLHPLLVRFVNAGERLQAQQHPVGDDDPNDGVFKRGRTDYPADGLSHDLGPVCGDKVALQFRWYRSRPQPSFPRQSATEYNTAGIHRLLSNGRTA